MVTPQISTRTAPPQVGKPWQKGQSGNPGGRPKVAASVKEEARKHTKEALGRLVHWMRSEDPQASIRASMAILYRGCGKPTPTLAVQPDEPRRRTVFFFDPFKDHRQQMEARESEKQADIPAATEALPGPSGKD